MRTCLAVLLLAALPFALAASPQTPAAQSVGADRDGDSDAEESDDSEPSAWQQASRARFAQLAPLPLPRDRAIAALQVFFSEPGAFRPVLAEAAAAAPDDVLVQWLAIHLLNGSDGGNSCRQSGPALAQAEHLVRLDVDNAAAHLPRLSRAWHDRDTAAVDSSIAAMAAAPRYDSYFFDIVDASMKLWQQFPLELPFPAGAEAEGLDPLSFDLTNSTAEASLVMPDYSVLIQACDASRVDLTVNVRRFAACGDIGRRMIAASTWIDRGMGFVVLRRSGQLTAEEAARKTQLDTLRKQAFALFVTKGITEEVLSVQSRALLELRDEIAAAEVVVAHFPVQAASTTKRED